MDELSADTCPRTITDQDCLASYVRWLLRIRGINEENLFSTCLVEDEWAKWAVVLMDRVLKRDLLWVISKCIDTWEVLLDLTPSELEILLDLNCRNFSLTGENSPSQCADQNNNPSLV